MINAAETLAPAFLTSEQKSLNAAVTVPPDRAEDGRQTAAVQPGDTIAESYVLDAMLEKQGTQAVVWKAKKWGKSYLVKLYTNGFRPPDRLSHFLKTVRHPNIAGILENGDVRGCYYEIYEYYSGGTLEDRGALSPAYIEKVLVPSVNEGLHELHRNGIVHCDIKPSNLFCDRDDRVVIGDCGISDYVNADGKLLGMARGTPEYAPPVRMLSWNASLSPAYDYGSFGLVLLRMILGRSFFEGMSVEEIARAWDRGLELPAAVTGRMKTLMEGLLQPDEAKRWGYDEVKRWCEHDYVSSVRRNIYDIGLKNAESSAPTSMVFGTFDGETISVSSLRQLELAIKRHWTQAGRIVKRRELPRFVRQFDRTLADKVARLVQERDPDVAAYKLLVYIAEDPTQIFFRGKDYGSLANYAEQLATGLDDDAGKFISSGLLVFYLRQNEYDAVEVNRLEQLIRRKGFVDTEAVSTICRALLGQKSLDLDGCQVETLEELIPVLTKYSVKEIDALLGNSHFIAWMNRLGYESEMRRMKEVFA